MSLHRLPCIRNMWRIGWQWLCGCVFCAVVWLHSRRKTGSHAESQGKAPLVPFGWEEVCSMRLLCLLSSIERGLYRNDFLWTGHFFKQFYVVFYIFFSNMVSPRNDLINNKNIRMKTYPLIKEMLPWFPWSVIKVLNCREYRQGKLDVPKVTQI